MTIYVVVLIRSTLLMSTHNICCHGGIRNILICYHPTLFHSYLEIWLACLNIVLMSTHNICFVTKMTKTITKIIFLSMVVNYSSVEMTSIYMYNVAQTSNKIFDTRSKNVSRRHFEIFCLFSPALTIPIFWKKKR